MAHISLPSADLTLLTHLASYCRPLSQRKRRKKTKQSYSDVQGNSKWGFKFVPLDLDALICAVFVDGSAKNADLSSQLGFIMLLMHKHYNVNVVHYGSIKSKQIICSVLSSELFSMIQGFDVSSTIRLAINDMLGRAVPLHTYTDSRSLFDCLTKISRTTEKRLLIDLSMLCQSHESREITELFWT